MARHGLTLLSLLVAGVSIAACSGLRDQEIVIDDEGGDAGSAGKNAGGSQNGGSTSGGSNSSAGVPDDGVGGLPDGGAPSLDGPPTVVSVKPADGADGVGPNSALRIDFSEELDETTITTETIQLKAGANPVEGELEYQAASVIFTPSQPLTLLTSYEVSVSTAVKDATGVALEEAFSSRFSVRDGAWDPTEVPFAAVYTANDAASVGVDARGNVLVSWAENFDIKARWYDAATSTWGAITSVESSAVHCGYPRVAVSENGNAVVAFELQDNIPQTWARRYVNGAWEAAPQVVQNPPAATEYLTRVQPVFHGDNILLVWSRRSGVTNMKVDYIDSATAGPTGGWKVFASMESAPQGGTKRIGQMISADMDPLGNAIVTYGYAPNTTAFFPTYIRYTSTTGAWSTPAPLRQGTQPALADNQLSYGPIVAMNASGDAAVAWGTINAGVIDLVGSHFTRAGGWDAPTPLETGGGNAFIAPGGVAAHGADFTVVFKQDIGDGAFNAYRNTYSGAKSAFGSAALLSSGDTNVWFGEPHIVGDARGNALVVWSEGGDAEGVNPTVTFARYNALAGTWGAPGKLTSLTDEGYAEPFLFGGPSGQAAAILATYSDGSWTGARVNLFH